MTDTNNVENEDKKIIADEEREKMLNAENIIREETKDKIEEIERDLKELEKEKEAEGESEKRDDEEEGVLKTGEVEKRKKQLEESQKEGRGKIRVPIGAIKIPGFLRSKDKNKDAEGTVEEGTDLLQPSAEKTEEPSGLRASIAKRLETIASKNPFAKKDATSATATEGEEPKPRLLDRIKMPAAVAVLPKKFTRGNKNQKQSLENGAELASSETLEDRKPSVDDEMESVKLDGDEDKDAEKGGVAGEPKRPLPRLWLDRLTNLSRHEKAVGFVIVFLILLVLIIGLCMRPLSPPPTAPPVVDGKVVTTTQCGPVEGIARDGIHVFKGIPYAVPPVKERRWKHAQELNNIDLCWDGTYLAHNASRLCWQYTGPSRIDGYEDCLTLDIYSREVRYINPMPVVVLIDAASLIGGTEGALQPTPKIVLSKEVVIVKPNFRLGVLGFLAASALREDADRPRSGNYGLSDILVALRWVQTNILHFGGDPKQVTVLGHRAGATLVTALVTSPLAKGLFSRAWASSGSSIFPGDSVTKQELANQRYVDSFCMDFDDLKRRCLEEKNAETLIEGTDEEWRRPAAVDLPTTIDEATDKIRDWLAVDGVILRDHVWKADAQAQLVVGSTAQSEATVALWEKMNKKFSGEREETIRTHVTDSIVGRTELAPEALKRYNATWEGLVTMISDIKTVCPLLVMSRARPNITFYVATMTREHNGIGNIADVDLDVSAIMGTYEPQAPAQRDFVRAMQDLFYKYVESGELPKKAAQLQQPFLNISRSTEWVQDSSNCDFWIANNIVPMYARKD